MQAKKNGPSLENLASLSAGLKVKLCGKCMALRIPCMTPALVYVQCPVGEISEGGLRDIQMPQKIVQQYK